MSIDWHGSSAFGSVWGPGMADAGAGPLRYRCTKSEKAEHDEHNEHNEHNEYGEYGEYNECGECGEYAAKRIPWGDKKTYLLLKNHPAGEQRISAKPRFFVVPVVPVTVRCGP